MIAGLIHNVTTNTAQLDFVHKMHVCLDRNEPSASVWLTHACKPNHLPRVLACFDRINPSSR